MEYTNINIEEHVIKEEKTEVEIDWYLLRTESKWVQIWETFVSVPTAMYVFGSPLIVGI